MDQVVKLKFQKILVGNRRSTITIDDICAWVFTTGALWPRKHTPHTESGCILWVVSDGEQCVRQVGRVAGGLAEDLHIVLRSLSRAAGATQHGPACAA